MPLESAQERMSPLLEELERFRRRSRLHLNVMAFLGALFLGGLMWFAGGHDYPRTYMSYVNYTIWLVCASSLLNATRVRRVGKRIDVIAVELDAAEVDGGCKAVMDLHERTGDGPGYCSMCPGTVTFPCPQYLTAQAVFSMTAAEKSEAVREGRLGFTATVEVDFADLPPEVQEQLRRSMGDDA